MTRYLIVLCCLFSLTQCVNVLKIKGEKTKSASAQASKKILVVCAFSEDYEKISGKIEEAVTKKLETENHVTKQVFTTFVNEQAVNEKIEQARKDFQPDLVLFLGDSRYTGSGALYMPNTKFNTSTGTWGNDVHHDWTQDFTFDVRLSGGADKSLLWNGSMHVQSNMKRVNAGKVAQKILDELKTDHVLK